MACLTAGISAAACAAQTSCPALVFDCGLPGRATASFRPGRAARTRAGGAARTCVGTPSSGKLAGRTIPSLGSTGSGGGGVIRGSGSLPLD